MPSRSVDPLTLFFSSVFKTARSDLHTQRTQRLLCFSTQSSVSGRPRRTLNVHPSPLQTQSPPGGQKHRQDGESGRVVVVVVVRGGLSAELACLQGSADAAVASAAPLTINTFPVHHHHPPPHQQHDNSSSHQCIALQPHMRRRHNTCD